MNMNLEQYFHKTVHIVDVDDREYIVEARGFTYAKDNGDIGEDSIAVVPAGIELAESDIKSIEIVES